MPVLASHESIRCTRLELSVLCLIAAVILYQLMVPPLIGIADTGDFARVTGPFSLGYLPGQEVEASYFISKYQFGPEASWDSGFVTSESLLVGIAIALNRLVSKDGLFDIRVLGLVHTVVLLLTVWLLLVCSRRLGRFARAVFIVLLTVAVTDVGYVQWFNSFYSETASYLFFLAAAGLGWRLIQRRGGLPLLLLWALAAILLVGAKPQHAPLGLALGIFAFHLRTLGAGRVWRRCSIGIAIAMLAWSAVYFRIAPYQEMREMNYYSIVFYGVLAESPNPAQDLAELGLPPELARFAGRNPYPADSGVGEPAFRQAFFARMNYGKILRFYAAHPGRFVGALDRGAREALLLRDEGLSNFERGSGQPPHALSHAFELWSFLHARAYPRRVAWLALALGLYCAALVFIRRKRSDAAGRMETDFVAVVLAMAVIEYVVVVMAAGPADPTKHMFLVDVLVDASLLAAAAWASGRASSLVTA